MPEPTDTAELNRALMVVAVLADCDTDSENVRECALQCLGLDPFHEAPVARLVFDGSPPLGLYTEALRVVVDADDPPYVLLEAYNRYKGARRTTGGLRPKKSTTL